MRAGIKMIDFRSDTVTQQTEQMRQAMLTAKVGDDVYLGDPTVVELEELIAEILNKEAALFVPSGTFSNQLAIMTHTNRGEEIIVEAGAHIKKYEVGATAALSGVNLHTIKGTNGKMALDELEQGIRADDIHYPKTSLICLENAFSGRALDTEYMKDVYKIAKKHDLNLHLDGARLFNACVALKIDPQEMSKYADTISICLSKGLCSPVGSLLVGPSEFIKKARKYRKMLGGGMRQVGFLAAAGIISLKEMRFRLEEDHRNAKYLAEQLNKIASIEVDFSRLDISMVFIKITHPKTKELATLLKEKDILIGGYADELRITCHNDISRENINYLISCLKEILV